jgi:ion channel-forming bestrophin family protein
MTQHKVGWLKLALQVQASIFPEIFPRIVLCSGFALLISLIHYYGFSLQGNIFGSITSNVAYNLVLGLLLVFRTNTAYDRYWEGRKTWGSIVISILNLGRKIQQAVTVNENEAINAESKSQIIQLLSAFAIATKLHLRTEPANNQLKEFLTESQFSEIKHVINMPITIVLWIGDSLKKQQISNHLSMDEFNSMNSLLDNMVEAVMGCERIAKTPMPLAYAVYLKLLLLIYCLFLPLQLINDLNWWTVLIVALISFILLGIEEIGNQIEDPFGHDENDLPLDMICKSVIENVEELINQDDIS